VLGAARALPGSLAQLLPLPAPSLEVGFVHADDVADALVRMLDRRAAGPFNLSADPVMDAGELARALGTRRVPVPALLARTALSAAFRAHLVPTEPGWLDIGIKAPALDTTRARTVLGWTPEHRGEEVLRQFVAALGRGEGAADHPLLEPAGGPARDPGGDRANTP
jgi:UDP-glucose 4-epimerase